MLVVQYLVLFLSLRDSLRKECAFYQNYTSHYFKAISNFIILSVHNKNIKILYSLSSISCKINKNKTTHPTIQQNKDRVYNSLNR